MQCLFSGSETDSKEHVVPHWLQRRFDLGEKTIIVPNGTELKYKLLVVPADRAENSKFGEIENRISQGCYNLDEVYLWALKIHIGLIFRDSSLRVNIRDPESEFILDIGSFESEITLFRILYENWKGGGKTSPLPFGSVFIFDSLLPRTEFDLFHCLTTGTVGIHIGGKFIIVFFWDQGDAMESNIEEQWTQNYLPIVEQCFDNAEKEEDGYIAHHVWACESAYWLYRNRRPINMLRFPTEIALIPPKFRQQPMPFNKEEYSQICRSFGLELVSFNGEVGNVYKPYSRVET